MPRWVPSFSDILKTGAHQVEKRVGFVRSTLKNALGLRRPGRVLPYRGYANGESWFVLGRVLEDKPISPPQADDPWWRNARSTLRRFATSEVPYARVIAEVGGRQYESQCDEEGYFRFEADWPDGVARRQADDEAPEGWRSIALRVVEDKHPSEVERRGRAKVRVLGERVEFGVISDVDDTVMESSATDFLKLAKLTLLKNALTRTPLDGVSHFYRLLEAGAAGDAHNPFFYVSSSAWNVFDLIEDFLRHNDVPLGPVMLRDLGIDDQKFIKSGHDQKYDVIERIMSFYDGLPFVLVGDAGQDDPVIYREVIRRAGDRVKAVFIRAVSRSARNEKARQIAAESTAQGTPMILVEESTTAIAEARKLGLVAGGERSGAGGEPSGVDEKASGVDGESSRADAARDERPSWNTE